MLKAALDLDLEQTRVLRELLEAAIRDLNYEIANTDNSIFKHGLQRRRTTMRSVLDALEDEGQDRSDAVDATP